MKEIIRLRVLLAGVLTAAAMTALSCVIYQIYAKNWVQMPGSAAEVEMNANGTAQRPIETPQEVLLQTLFGYQCVLYKQLCSTEAAQKGEDEYFRYQELFFEKSAAQEKFPEYLAYLLYLDDEEELKNAYNRRQWKEQYENEVYTVKQSFSAYLNNLEENRFSEFNRKYDYWIRRTDDASGTLLLTNTQVKTQDPEPAEYAFLYRIIYDSYGVPEIGDLIAAENPEILRRNLNAVLHGNPISFLQIYERTASLEEADVLNEAVLRETRFRNPVNCEITVGMTLKQWNQEAQIADGNETFYEVYHQFNRDTVYLIYWGLLLMAAVLGGLYLNPLQEEKRAARGVLRMPMEILVIPTLILIVSGDHFSYRMTRAYLRNDSMLEMLGTPFLFFGAAWYIGGCLGEARILGLEEYEDKRFLLIRFWNRLRKKVREAARNFQEIRLSDDLRKKARALVILNGVVLTVFCLFWAAGVVCVVLYSILLYHWLLRYLAKIQGEYGGLQRMTREMAAGNLKCQPEGELGIFEPLREDLVSIRDGFDAAVQEEVKSQRMKTELITNVSHDLKTPLTAIITYINLLKDDNLTREQQTQYLGTLEKKSLRLKTLIEDLFEVSKANSGNVQLNLQSCDLVNLLKQVSLEMQDKLEERHLTTRLLLPEEKVILKLDSEKTYRVYENLFGNVAKYAMEGTRVYVGLLQSEERVSVVIKNITEAEISVPPQELSERFVRGDVSRGSVEGSGLGLAIVRSFTELQGGTLEIDIDGDLFKVTTSWKKE